MVNIKYLYDYISEIFKNFLFKIQFIKLYISITFINKKVNIMKIVFIFELSTQIHNVHFNFIL